MSCQKTYNFFPAKEGWGFTAFAQQPGTQKYWMALQSGGLAIYNKATGQLSYLGNNIENEPAIERYRGIAIFLQFPVRQQGKALVQWLGQRVSPMFIVTMCAISNLFLKSMSLFPPLRSYNEVGGFFEQKDSTIWIMGLKVFGRYIEADKRFELVLPGYQNERSIDYRHITALCEDKEKNIWVGTGNNGLYPV